MLPSRAQVSTPVACASASAPTSADGDGSPAYWVVVRYNGQALTLPGQADPFTPLDDFRALVRGIIVDDFEAECGAFER